MIDVSLTAAALEGEPWRLWTGHLVHWGTGHLLTNLVAMLPPLILLRWRESARLALLLVLAAPLVSVPILASGVDPYRGSSGLVVGFWCAAALVLIGRRESLPSFALLTLAAGKLTLEALGVPLWPHDGFVVVPLAHQAGAVVGMAVGVLCRVRIRNERPAATYSPRPVSEANGERGWG